MKRILRRLTSYILLAAAVLTVAVPGIPPAGAAYSDTGRHWASAEISRWEALGVLSDFGSGAFRPDAPITRAEFFSIIVRALGAEEEADISRFTDVPADAWYHGIVARANKMRIAEGTSETTMRPESNIIRQDAATLVARAIGLTGDDTNYLGRYADRGEISVYAQNYVSAMTQYGYMVGSGSRFNPRANLSRAEAVKIIDNLFRHYYGSESGFDNLTLDGNVISVRPDSVFNGLTLNGDLILGDGVGSGSAALNDCVINGRLLIRGGGENSVVLSNTAVRGGITVVNPNLNTRVVTSGTTSVQTLTAFSGFTLVGTGVHDVKLAQNAIPGAQVTLSGVVLDSMDVGGATAMVTMPDGKISNLSFTGDSAGSQFSLGRDSSVSYLTTVSPNISLYGDGRIADAFINAPGAVFTAKPDTYTIGANLTASIAGEVVSGEYLDTGNWVTRGADYLPVRQDTGATGGTDVLMSTARGRSANAVTVTLRPQGKIPVSSDGGRPGYHIGFFIPAPPGLSARGGTIPMLTYQNSDGGIVVMRGLPLTYQNGEYGIWFRIPVTRDANLDRGRLAETMYIEWDGGTSENLIFTSGWLDLEPLMWYDENTLVSMYRYARMEGHNGAIYYGAEAIRRLLCGDNALGLDTKGFAAFTAQDQIDLAASLYETAGVFVTRQAIQDKLDQVISGKGALYAVNRALTTDQMRRALEHPVFARELGIEVSAGSAYGIISETGKDRVAYTLLMNRKTDYANNAAVKTAFDKAVADVKTAETGLLVAINNAPAAADVQKIVETKANADLLKFVPASEPYKSFTAPQKLNMAQRIFERRPFSSVDDVARIIQDFLATAGPGNPEDDTVINSLKLTPASISLVFGQSAHIGYGAGADVQLAIATPSGTVPNPLTHVTAEVDKESIASYNAVTGVVTAGQTAGTAKITLTSTTDTKKKVTLSVKVDAPVPATGIKLSKSFVEVEVGGKLGLGPNVTVIPAKSTDKLLWTSENSEIASVNSETGEVTGVRAGFTLINVRTTSGQTASCLVAVISLEPGVMIYPASGTVGIEESMQFYAVVSPITVANRTVRWTTSNASIAKVDGSGKVTGVSTGAGDPLTAQVTITATAARDAALRDEATLTVDQSVKNIKLSKSEMVLFPGGTERIEAAVLPATGSGDQVVWSVGTGGNELIAFIDDSGEAIQDQVTGLGARVVGLRAGKTTLIAALDGENSDVIAVCEVEVLEGKPTITVAPKTLSLTAGDKNNASKLVTVSFTPNNISNKTVNWVSADPLVAAVEVDASTGRVRITGLSEGETIIRGVPEADKDSELIVDVVVKGIAITQFSITPKPPASITITQGNTELLSKLYDIVMKPDDVSNKKLVWTSGNQNSALIKESAQGEETDEFGGARLEALSPTMTSYEKPILDNGNPVYDSNGDPQFEIGWLDKPITLTAQASNGQTIEVLLSIEPQETSQLTNIKIDMDTWIYPVGTEQLMTVRYNITGRNADGSWTTGKQPPNVKLTWNSNEPGVAYVDSTGRLIAKSKGMARITVTSQDGAKSDTVTVVVTDYGPSGITFDGLTTGQTSYGDYIKMNVGETSIVTPRITPSTAVNSALVWTALKWTYNNDNKYDPSGTTGIVGTATDMLRLTSTGVNGRTLTALKPGFVQVTVKPDSPDTLDFMSLNDLWARCGGDNTRFDSYLAKNYIEVDGSNYYSTNEWNLDLTVPRPANPNVLDPVRKIKLDPAKKYNLIGPNTSIDKDGVSFMVWITNAPLNSVSFDTLSGKTLADKSTETVELTATLNPAPYVDPETPLTWDYDTAILTMTSPPVYAPATGKISAEFKLLSDIADSAGTYPIKLTATSKQEEGLRSHGSPPQEPLEHPAVTQSATYVLTVQAPISTSSVASATPAKPNNVQSVQTSVPAPVSSVEVAAGVHSAELMLAASGAGIAAPSAVYASADPAVATVDSFGVITAVAAGETDITAEAGSRKIAVRVRVSGQSAAAGSEKTLRLRGAATIAAGRSLTLMPLGASGKTDLTGVTWASSKPDIAAVDASGRVTGVKAGKTVITATVAGTKLKGTCTVTVSGAPKAPVTGLSVNKAATTLEAGKAEALKAVFAPAAPTVKGVTWMSTNSGVATVSDAGKVTAVAAGTATVIAVSDDGGYSAVCTVTVTPKPVKATGIALDRKTLSLTVGASDALTYTITPADATNKAVTWKSSNTRIVTVDAEGRVTAVKKGTATITVTTADGSRKSATCKVTVT